MEHLEDIVLPMWRHIAVHKRTQAEVANCLDTQTNQVPFTSVTLGMDTSEKARRITKGILNAYDAGLGHGEQPLDYAGLSAGMRR